MKVIWEIKNPNGEVVARGEHDKLATKNFVRLLAKIFTAQYTTLVTKDGGTFSGTNFKIGVADGYVELGRGAVSPTRDDYKLSGEVIASGDVSVSIDETNAIVTIGFAWTATTDTVVNEVGLYARPEADVLLDRFLLGQTVTAGQTLSIAWIINLGGL